MINDDEEHSIQYKEYLEKSPDAITTVLPIEEPEYSLSMGYEHLSTILETESDEVTESSAKTFYQSQVSTSGDSISIPENESSDFDHQDDLSFPRPPPKPPDIEIFFEPDSGVLTTNVVKGISEHYVLMPNILPILPTIDPLYPVYDTLLPFSSENDDKVFKPGILSYLLVSHQDKNTSDFSENPMMMYGGDIPLLDVSYLHFYPP
nr:hypothetical protein [Tanacetum cinerariifolium]GEY91871.1 hypothetical protein [Tanacetum cinerariifolium]